MVTSLVRIGAAAVIPVVLLVLLVMAREAGDGEVAAEVNGAPIPVGAVESRFASVTHSPLFAEELEDDQDGTLAVEVRASILTELIRARLWEQGAAELGIEVTAADVVARRWRHVEEMGGEAAFDEQVERYALDEDDFAAVLRDRVVRERVQETLVADVRAQVQGRPAPEEEARAVRRWAAEQVEDASVEVDPRFGAWDASAGRVDPSPALERSSEDDGERA